MSKKVVRSRESYIKNWTAAITGSFVLVSAQSASAHERGAFREFRANNPGLEKRELRQAFRQQVGGGGLGINPVADSVAKNVSVPTINSRQQARLEAKMLRHDGALKHTFQADLSGQINNVQRGVDLDLTSQVANITLGEKLFGNTSSIEIQVGGVTKTLSAGAQVTAAEYVAAKQVLAGVGQRVTIGAGGGATGGDVDLSAITTNGDVMRASNLTVPVNVTATGDFSRGSDFRLLGDLDNSGNVHATDSTGGGRGGTLRADDILNNASGSITSDVDLNLHADGSLVNHGNISSQGNLTITSSDVTNRGSISSANNVNLNANAEAGGLNVDNAGGTISAANNINVNTADLDASLSGGNYLSKNLNLNAGAGTITASLDDVTGSVNSTGYAVHFGSATETLNIGDTDLVDPTFYNFGNINFTGNLDVAADLAIIATGNITEGTGAFRITTNNNNAATDGGALTIIAGANITSATGATSGSLPAGTPAGPITFNEGSISGGSIALNTVTLNTKGIAGGGNGGNLLLAAFAGFGDTNGSITIGGTSTITTGGAVGGTNGDVTIIAPNGITLGSSGGVSINAAGGAGGGGDVAIRSAQPTTNGAPVTYNASGTRTTANQVVASSAVEVATMTIGGSIAGAGGVSIVAGDDLTLGAVTAGTDVALFSGVDPNTLAVINANADITLNGVITATTGSVLLESADDITQNNNANIVANTSVTLDAIGGGYSQNGSVTSNTDSVFITAAEDFTMPGGAGDTITAENDVNITVGGDFTRIAAITAGGGAEAGGISITVGGDFDATSGNADITAGQGVGIGDVFLSAQGLDTTAGANILGNDVTLISDNSNGGALDLDGNVAANKDGDTTGVLSLTLNGTNLANIADANISGGLNAQQITIANNTGGDIAILNTGTNVNFRDVTVNAAGDITLFEQNGGGRDGNINFTGNSVSGATFTVVADSDITGSVGSGLTGVTGDLRSNGVGGVGNIGSSANVLNVNFTDIRVQALGGPSLTAGNAFLSTQGNLNFAGLNSQITGRLEVTALGSLTSSAATTVQAGSASLTSINSGIGTSLLNPFNLDVATGAGLGADIQAQNGDAFIFDQNDSQIGSVPGNLSGAFVIFSYVSGGDLFVTNNFAGDDVIASNIILSAANTLDFASGATIDSTFFAGTNDTVLSATDITSGVGSNVIADNLSVSLNGGVGTVNTTLTSLDTIGSTGSLTINEADGIEVNAQGALTNLTVNAGQTGTGDVFTNNDFSVGTLNISNDDGNIFINTDVTGTTAVNLDTSAGGGGISGSGTIISPSISLFTDTGTIFSNVNGTGSTDTTVTAQTNASDTTLNYLGSGDLTLGASTGNNNFQVVTNQATAVVVIGGDIDGAGLLDISANVLEFGGSFNLDFDSATVQSLATSGLTLDGGTGGTFTTTVGGAGVTLTATDGDFVGINTTNFVGGDLVVTLANNNGINAFDLVTGPGILNGDNSNQVTVNAALVIGSSLSNLTNWANIILLGNTIYNSAGDVVLPANLTFTGQDLAIIASGNVTATGITINLGNANGSGGNLFVLAGFDTDPTTGGAQVEAQFPVTVTGFSATGGNIDMTGTDIITSSTDAGGGDAGDVFVYAAGINSTTGIVTGLGDIDATAVNGSGGFVAVGGSGGVTVGNIDTAGSAAGGDVALGVGTIAIVPTPVFTGGTLSGGGFLPAAISGGNLSAGNVTAGDGDILIAGGLNLADNAITGTLQGDNLEVFMGSGFVNLQTNVNEVQVDATSGANGILFVTEANQINVDGITGNDTIVLIDATGADITLIGDTNVGGGGGVILRANNIFTATTEKITAGALELSVGLIATLNTDVDILSTSVSSGSVTINEDDGITLNTQTADLTITAGLVAAGDITTSADFSVANVDLTNDNGNIIISNEVEGTSSVSLDTSGGVGSISGAGTLIGPSIDLFADTGNITANVNGSGGLDTDVLAEAGSGGDVSLTYLGTGTMTLFASTGNGNYTVAGSALNGGDIAIDGDIDGTGSLSITTDNLSFASASELAFADISVQSFAGTGLTVTGGAGQGTFTTDVGGAGVTFTATTGNLTTNDQLNFNGGDVFMTLATNNGINSFTNNGVLNGDGAFNGDPAANALTITASLITLGTIQNFSNVNIIQGNTIVSATGDVLLPANLVFQGQDLAIIAFGDVIATGAALIDLSSTTGDGGNLTVLAGFTTDATGGQQQTSAPVTVTGFSTTGGNIDLTGVDIDTSSTVGDAGDVTLAAQSPGILAEPGTVIVGNITADGAVNGGVVNVGGYGGVTVGNVSATGGTADGFVGIGAVDVEITGTPVFTNGSLTGGSFEAGELETGNVSYGTIDVGSGDVVLAGALGALNTIGGGQISADDLLVVVGAGSANLSTDVFDIAVDATTAAGGSVGITEDDDVTVSSVTGSDLDLAITTTGDLEFDGNLAVGTGTVALTANDVIQSSGTFTAANLGLNLTGNVALTTAVTNLLDSVFANMTLTNTGALTVNDLQTTGFVDIFNTGNFTVAAGSDIDAVDRITFQTLGSAAGTITIGAAANIQTNGATKPAPGAGDVSILQGDAPTKTRNLKGKNLVVDNSQGPVLTGKGKGTKKITALAPNNNLSAINATLLIKAQSKGGVTLSGDTTIIADPPFAPVGFTTATVRNNDAPVQGMTEALAIAPSVLSPINAIPTLTSAPSINLNNIDNTLSNLATANTNIGALNQMEDDSFISYVPMGQIVDGNLCSDMDFGFSSGSNAGSGSAVATMKHSDCVTLNNGSALFVPTKDMTVVTPKGSVKLAAQSVAFVSVNSNQLSVYDINDNHKSSVVVSTGGRDLTLSPGRHLVVTHDKAKTFADINPIESIMHRSVNRHNLGAGKQAFVSEFSIPSAVNVVKPLKAMLNSNDANAKKVAARILKTTAVVMMVGGQAPFDFHAKPRTVALNWK